MTRYFSHTRKRRADCRERSYRRRPRWRRVPRLIEVISSEPRRYFSRALSTHAAISGHALADALLVYLHAKSSPAITRNAQLRISLFSRIFGFSHCHSLIGFPTCIGLPTKQPPEHQELESQRPPQNKRNSNQSKKSDPENHINP